MSSSYEPNKTTRRHVLGVLAGLGVTSATFSRALAVEAEKGTIDSDAIARAEWVSDIELSDEQRDELVRSIVEQNDQLKELRAIDIDADVPPALGFSPWSESYGPRLDTDDEDATSGVELRTVEAAEWPTNDVDLAFAPLRVLASMIRAKEISCVELTKFYLDRLERHGPTLNCVVTFTEDLALQQAKVADREIAAGRIRGPLHGIPWGAKDLIAVDGYPTTWGCSRFQDQVRQKTATVAKRLEAAGAVLLAKLSLGAIAMGDQWFGGRTLNPWNLEQGSSGSSAGSAAATSAGLVPFALGSETLGSIVSPSRRCGTTGLRPTFGRVSRFGCMPLAWSFDKIGPICRSVEDTAYVFAAIHGADGKDPTCVTRPFRWQASPDISGMSVGYTGADTDREDLEVLRNLGVTLKQISLPEDLPTWPLASMLEVESASMFYDEWREGDEEGLNRWGKIWQAAAFVPAVDYIRASRIRTMLMERMEAAIEGVDLYVGGNDLVLTNLTGHPTVVMPYRRQRRRDGDQSPQANESPSGTSEQAAPRQPSAITFSGHLHGETKLLAVADAFQRATGHHLPRPPLFTQP